MKIAFATQDKERVDAHFGWAKSIDVYEISATGHHFVESFEFGDKLEEDGDEDKLAPKLEAIKDCAILYVAAIGGSGAARVVAMKIHPIKVPQPENIAEILDKLQAVLQGTPPPWLRKAMAKDSERAFDFEDDEVTP
ncbi:MAG TPA: nitrogen fixation protein NifX [Hydrogenophaga sp.]|jgi:nitrogen fixation protein NifX|uniref:nitrogen fixation protein NifX n=1 Tax=Hydrogenophaga sp. TaxID=1904254 RepID=UPI0008C33A19|nr:nitrogen fixation protein NifX [Hydrogenophaga sp.]MBU4181893.1 nitrogen fixation protein NifX [Gammaproteobacteria bacterium]MBW8471402.1 nitrogen fixation protein NifX [Thiobacillus sp.]OGA76475.1 MAG: nitrogen fixation protein NifX [Burkholderiales bacterium GWE1_65_30]OGA91391.1 MAG: nitrogen fixation protein NifX [Burkholderiales bacterium GWF1_66_17]OGB35267.1 MAG: nitrogen fixation protein NifX [Burkholderiales bacterium RIFCSPLOWO2_02_FULL_66_35]PKO77626.1 MAG: nitrogen fixation pr